MSDEYLVARINKQFMNSVYNAARKRAALMFQLLVLPCLILLCWDGFVFWMDMADK